MNKLFFLIRNVAAPFTALTLVFLLAAGSAFALDSDGDGTPDQGDNCSYASNSSQSDSDSDDYGNACDCDYDQNETCGLSDVTVFIGCFGEGGLPLPGTGPADDPTCAESDQDANNLVGFNDLLLFLDGFGGPPGPSGSAQGTPPLFGIHHKTNKEIWLSISTATALATEVGLMQTDPFGCCRTILGMAYDPFNEVMYGIDNRNVRKLLTIDPVTGATAGVGPTNLAGDVMSLAFNPLDRQLYTVRNGPSGGSGTLYRIDPGTGSTTYLGLIDLPKVGALAFARHPGTGEITLYAADRLDETLAIIDISGGAPVTTVVGTVFSWDKLDGLAYDWQNDVMYGASNEYSFLITIDLSTAEGELVKFPVGLGFGNVHAIEFVYDAALLIREGCGNDILEDDEQCDGAALDNCPAGAGCFEAGATDPLTGASIECTCAPDHCDPIDVNSGGNASSGTFTSTNIGAPRGGDKHCGGTSPKNKFKQCHTEDDCGGCGQTFCKRCAGGSNVGADCFNDSNCPGGTCASKPGTNLCLEIPWLGVGVFEPFPIAEVSVTFTADEPDAKCVHQATIPCGNLRAPCPGTPKLGVNSPCCSNAGFSVQTYLIPALSFCSRVDQTGCAGGVVDTSVPMLGDNDVRKRGDTTAPQGPDCTYLGTEDHGPCIQFPGCAADGDEDCDKKGQTIATIGDGVFDSPGGHNRFTIPQRSVTWFEIGSPPCDPSDKYDGIDMIITNFDLQLSPTTATSDAAFVDGDEDADDRAFCGAGPPSFPGAVGSPDLPGEGSLTAATGAAFSGGAPLYDLLFSALTPLTSPVLAPPREMCSPAPPGCPE